MAQIWQVLNLAIYQCKKQEPERFYVIETQTKEDVIDPPPPGTLLTNADLQETDLTNARFRNIDFEQANLQKANLTNAWFEWVDFGQTNLRGANFEAAVLTFSDLQQVTGITLEQLSNAKLCYTILPDFIPLNPNGACLEVLPVTRYDYEFGKQGEEEEIFNIQFMLSTLGYYPYDFTYYFDLLMEESLKKFQEDIDIEPTGKADLVTINALKEKFAEAIGVPYPNTK